MNIFIYCTFIDLVNSTDCHQDTPLHYAVQYIEKVSEMEKVLEELIAHGAGMRISGLKSMFSSDEKYNSHWSLLEACII